MISQHAVIFAAVFNVLFSYATARHNSSSIFIMLIIIIITSINKADVM